MNTMSKTAARLNDIGPLKRGKHNNFSDGACVMEAVSYIAGEPWSDHPACACPVITEFLVTWNDALPNDERDALLRPLILRVVGTRGDAELEQRRSMMAVDWLVRVHTPAWLRLAKLDAAASALEGLPEIIDKAQYPSLMGPLDAAQKDADATWVAVEGAVWSTIWSAVWSAAVDTVGDTAGGTAGDAAAAAAGTGTWDAARTTVRAAVVDAVTVTAWDAAKAETEAAAAAGIAAWPAAVAHAAVVDALKPTRLRLQQSAVDLVGRMIEAKPTGQWRNHNV